MPRKSNQKKQKSKINRRNKKNNKKSLTKKQYKTVKKIAYNVTNNPRNKEWYQLKTGFYINNNLTLYRPSTSAPYNEYEFHNGNFFFYPLTSLGALEKNMSLTSVPNGALINLKSTYWLCRWVNSGGSDSNDDRIGNFSGRKLSINSIQIKGFFEMNNNGGFARPACIGFRIIKGGVCDERNALTTFADGVDKNIIPEMKDVYIGMKDNYILDSQDKLDQLSYTYMRDKKFNRNFKTLIKRYTYFNNNDLTVEKSKRSFNILKRFKYPLELIYPEACYISGEGDTSKYYMSLKNNLFFCPYFSEFTTDIAPGTNIKYPNTGYPFSDDGTYKIYGQIIINYTDS